jgi:rhodanese-related sulfurtransferase
MRACEYLESLGKKVTNVAGGTGAWIAIGNPVTVGDQP